MIFVVAQKVSGIAVKDRGEGPVRPATPYFEPKLRPEGPKKIFGDRLPPPPPPPPTPYLKVWSGNLVVTL